MRMYLFTSILATTRIITTIIVYLAFMFPDFFLLPLLYFLIHNFWLLLVFKIEFIMPGDLRNAFAFFLLFFLVTAVFAEP